MSKKNIDKDKIIERNACNYLNDTIQSHEQENKIAGKPPQYTKVNLRQRARLILFKQTSNIDESSGNPIG
ncbi:hypothetical protein [Pontibacter liquoris]|uniref:hypothetical protein n=1 Tax=Pontibacter liquoris TaxID=2905677 RepID=UPI001FA78642|nr:hypothetical protein [Pontibacter liquoris]